MIIDAQAALWFLPFCVPVAIWVAWSDMASMKIPNKAVLTMAAIWAVVGLLAFPLPQYGWGWAVLGKKFALNTLASSVLSPAFLALFERLLDGRVLTEDIFLCTIFSGLGIGVALGMVIRAGASTGGMDIPPLVLQKWFRWPVSVTMMLFDIASMASCWSSPTPSSWTRC